VSPLTTLSLATNSVGAVGTASLSRVSGRLSSVTTSELGKEGTGAAGDASLTQFIECGVQDGQLG